MFYSGYKSGDWVTNSIGQIGKVLAIKISNEFGYISLVRDSGVNRWYYSECLRFYCEGSPIF